MQKYPHFPVIGKQLPCIASNFVLFIAGFEVSEKNVDHNAFINSMQLIHDSIQERI